MTLRPVASGFAGRIIPGTPLRATLRAPDHRAHLTAPRHRALLRTADHSTILREG